MMVDQEFLTREGAAFPVIVSIMVLGGSVSNSWCHGVVQDCFIPVVGSATIDVVQHELCGCRHHTSQGVMEVFHV